MSPDAAGSQRIVVIGGGGGQPQPKPHPAPPPEPHPAPPPPVAHAPTAREVRQPGEASVKKPAMQQRGWTPRRLTLAGAFGAGASLLGGITFVSKFGVLGGEDSPLLAMGFGLFVIGMVVFCAALVALLGTGIGLLAERRGWSTAAACALGPLALIWALYLLGAVGYAVPAVLSLLLIAGLVAALK